MRRREKTREILSGFCLRCSCCMLQHKDNETGNGNVGVVGVAMAKAIAIEIATAF